MRLQQEINERTSLPFKILIPLAAMLIPCVWTVSAKLSAIETAMKNGWTVQDQQVWASKLARENLNVIVPDVNPR